MPAVHNLGEIVDRGLDPQTTWMIEVGPDDTVREFTFADFHRIADGIARALLARGLQRGQSVGILAGNSAEYLLAYFGIMRAGCRSGRLQESSRTNPGGRVNPRF